MHDFRTAAAMGIGFGGVALLFALPSLLPPAIASEEPARTLLSSASEIFPPPFNFDGLIKYTYEVTPSVSTEVLRESTVTKIGFGRAEPVHIVQTPSGTYSSDSLGSPNVEYPGVIRKRVRGEAALAYLSDGHWVAHKPVEAGSFVTITRFDGGQLMVTDDLMCVTGAHGVSCR